MNSDQGENQPVVGGRSRRVRGDRSEGGVSGFGVGGAGVLVEAPVGVLNEVGVKTNFDERHRVALNGGTTVGQQFVLKKDVFGGGWNVVNPPPGVMKPHVFGDHLRVGDVAAILPVHYPSGNRVRGR